MKFTEAKLEQAIIDLLSEEGYPHVFGEMIERQPQEVLIKADLRAFLSKQYAKDSITPGVIITRPHIPPPGITSTGWREAHTDCPDPICYEV